MSSLGRCFVLSSSEYPVQSWWVFCPVFWWAPCPVLVSILSCLLVSTLSSIQMSTMSSLGEYFVLSSGEHPVQFWWVLCPVFWWAPCPVSRWVPCPFSMWVPCPVSRWVSILSSLGLQKPYRNSCGLLLLKQFSLAVSIYWDSRVSFGVTNCFWGNFRETSERQDWVHVGISKRMDAVLNWKWTAL